MARLGAVEEPQLLAPSRLVCDDLDSSVKITQTTVALLDFDFEGFDRRMMISPKEIQAVQVADNQD